MHKPIKKITALVCAIWASSQPASASELTFLVSPERLKCFVENFESYLALSDDPVVIFLNACPRTVPNRQEILAMSTNSMPDLRKTDRDALTTDTIIALRKKEIRCLAEGIKTGKILPVGQKDADGKDAVRLQFNGC